MLFVAFFLVNVGFITYVVDLEQLVIADPARFSYPLWPPAPLVDLVHWYGNRFDPLLMAWPPFWRMTIWIDVLYFGPFYLAATYAFVRGRDWIGVPALVWSGLMLANVLIILTEERFGAWATPNFPFVLGLNLPWLLVPVAMIWRMRHGPPLHHHRGPRPSHRSPVGQMSGFGRQRYGPWALVAGASEASGPPSRPPWPGGAWTWFWSPEAQPLTALADRLPVRTLTVAADLATTSGLAAVEEATRDLEVGLVVVNAAYSPIGRLIDQDPARTRRALDLNCRAPLALARRYLPAMATRGRAG